MELLEIIGLIAIFGALGFLGAALITALSGLNH